MSTVTTTYAYDKGHNRTSKAVSGGATTTYVIGNGSNGAGANQIVSETTGGVTTDYIYDANGNRSSRTMGEETDTYTYDDENRLIELVEETGPNPGTYTYAYDYRTRRAARSEPGTGSTTVVFDGGISIIEYGAGGAGSPNVEYVRGHDYGGGVGGLEYSVRSGAASFNSFDSRGDVTTQSDSSGTVTYQTAYEAFGEHPTESGTTQDRQKASTKEEDPSGLLNEGFRYRDPDTGTFLSRDPLGFKAGPNMYTYVRQNPWTHFDPEGLDWNIGTRAFGGLMAVGGGVESFVGATLLAGGAAGSWTGVGLAVAAAGAVLAVHGADTAVTGVKQAVTGTAQQTLTQQAVTKTAQNLGASPTTAHVAGVAVDVGLGLASGGVGSMSKVAARGGMDAVTHLTNPTAAAAINATGTIKGEASGIHALQTSAVPSSNLGRNVATMVGGDLSKSVPITGQAASAFSRPPLTGPVSGFRNLAGQASTAPGTINTATMTFVATAKTTSAVAHAAVAPALDAGYHGGRALNATAAVQRAPNSPPPPPPKQNN